MASYEDLFRAMLQQKLVTGLLDDPGNNPGAIKLATNDGINLPVTPSGEPINMILSPDLSQPDANDEGDEGNATDGWIWINGKLKKIRKPYLPVPPTPFPIDFFLG
jgi:hypothetical protein